MALTNDIKSYEYGVGYGLVAYPVGATQQLYEGEVALISGSGSVTTGYLKNAATPGSADLVVGIIGRPAGGTAVATGPGFAGGTADGAVWADVKTGSFCFQSGTGADQLSEATNGKTVYLGNENAQGSIACATGSGTRPVLGIQLPQDPGFAGGCLPGPNYWPIKLNTIGGPST